MARPAEPALQAAAENKQTKGKGRTDLGGVSRGVGAHTCAATLLRCARSSGMRRCLSATSQLSSRALRRSFASSTALARSDDDAAWHAAQACRLVLVSTDPAEKAAALGVELGEDLEQVAVRSHAALNVSGAPSQVLDTAPARPEKPELVYGPFQRGNHSLPQYLLHSLAHIELNAVDIYAHTVAAWGPGGPRAFGLGRGLRCGPLGQARGQPPSISEPEVPPC